MPNWTSLAMAERIVINTGPLIALARMDALDVPGQLPYEFICPTEVREELDEGASLGYQTIAPPWLTVIPLSASPSAVSVAALDRGEAAVIQLAVEQGLLRVSIDEVKGPPDRDRAWVERGRLAWFGRSRKDTRDHTGSSTAGRKSNERGRSLSLRSSGKSFVSTR